MVENFIKWSSVYYKMKEMRKIYLNLLLITLLVAGFIISVSRIASLIVNSENSQFSSMPFSFDTLVRIAFWILLEIVIIGVFLVHRIRIRAKKGDEELVAKKIGVIKNKGVFFMGSMAVVLLFAMVVLSVSENSFLYHPFNSEEAEFYLDNNDSFERMTIDCDDLVLRGWLHRANGDSKKTLIYFGGNAETSATTLVDYDIDGMWNCFADYNFIMIDYPGYGLSDGKPNKDALFHMCDATIQHVIADDSLNQSVVVMGFSLGTGIATYAAANYDLDGLILIAPYDRMINVYNYMINIFHGPLKLIVKNNYKSDALAEKVDEKALIIASEDDEVIPYKLSINLYMQFGEKCDMLTVKEAGHNEIVWSHDARERIGKFLFTEM